MAIVSWVDSRSRSGIPLPFPGSWGACTVECCTSCHHLWRARAWVSNVACPFLSLSAPSSSNLNGTIRDVNLPLFGGIPLFFFFLLSAFFKIIFLFFFFWKIAPKKKKSFSLPTPPLSSVRMASVNNQWRLGLPVSVSGFQSKFESVLSPLSGRNLDARSHAACWRIVWAASTRVKGGWWFSGDGLEVIARVLPFELQQLHPLPFHPHHFTHTHTLSLSLSYTHTHTLTHWHSGLPTATISP